MLALSFLYNANPSPVMPSHGAASAGVAQLVEQLTCNEKVEGSIPFTGTNKIKFRIITADGKADLPDHAQAEQVITILKPSRKIAPGRLSNVSKDRQIFDTF